MQTPLQITYRGIRPTESIERYVRRRVDKLGRFSDRITGCHVTIETPHRHKRHGNHHRVRIDLRVPGKELVVARDPAARKAQEDLHSSIDSAFDDAKRLLEDHVRVQRGDVKPREGKSLHARVSKLFAYEGFGFLAAENGEEIYFHRNSVLDGGFDRLSIGTRVRYVPEMGDKGPQASTVAITS